MFVVFSHKIKNGKREFVIEGVSQKQILRPGYTCYKVFWKNGSPFVKMLGKEVLVGLHELKPFIG